MSFSSSSASDIAALILQQILVVFYQILNLASHVFHRSAQATDRIFREVCVAGVPFAIAIQTGQSLQIAQPSHYRGQCNKCRGRTDTDNQ